MFDFNKSFGDFVTEYMRGQSASYEEMEELVADLSAEWAALPQAALGGKSPVEYINGLSDGAELVSMMCSYADRGGVFPYILDKIERVPSAGPHLISLLSSDASDEAKHYAVNLLTGMDKIPHKLFVSMLFTDVSDDLKAVLAETLCRDADIVKDDLIAATKGNADNALIGEILSYCSKDDRVYKYLTSFLALSGDLPMSAGFLARYGDDRAISVLREAADDCNYYELTELRNAIEALGGELDITRYKDTAEETE